MEVAFLLRVGVDTDSRPHARLELESGVHDKSPVGVDELGEVCETLEVVLIVAIDIKMIRVGRCDHGNIGTELMERAVELIGLNHRIWACVGKQEVAAVVAQHAAEESVAAYAGGLQDVGRHARCGGLAVSAGKAQSLGVLGNHPEQLCPLHHIKPSGTEVLQSLVRCRHCWGVDHKGRLAVAAIIRNQVGILIVGDFHALLLKGTCQVGCCTVIAGHPVSLGQEITFEGSHSYAASSNKI